MIRRSLTTAVLLSLGMLNTSPARALDTPLAAIDPATIAMPELAFKPSSGASSGFDKYFYFARADTDFAQALGDLRQCDGLSSGLLNVYDQNGTTTEYMAGPIAGAIAAALFGPAEVRKVYRGNMRRCMHYKGYRRYGLPRDLWSRFNFEVGGQDVSEDVRLKYLAQQAKVASTARPQDKELGL